MAERSKGRAAAEARRPREGREPARRWTLSDAGRTLMTLAYFAGAAFNLAYTARHLALFERLRRYRLLVGKGRAVWLGALPSILFRELPAPMWIGQTLPKLLLAAVQLLLPQLRYQHSIAGLLGRTVRQAARQ